MSTSPDGRAAKVEALVVGDSRDERALAAVQRLRSDVVPEVFAGVDARVLVTGETAEVIDYRALTDRWLPIVFAFVLALSFLLLTLAFRTIVLPAVAIGLNLLSVGAAYGLLVLVFVDGVGRDLLGFTEVEVIAAWLPLFLFAVLFGLSMDYTVFLLSRIRERYAQGASTTEAVAFSVASTARIITGAALIIIAVFVGFAAGDQVEFQQLGFGVAVSLLIDATLVRLVLLPGRARPARRAHLVSAALARVAAAPRARGRRAAAPALTEVCDHLCRRPLAGLHGAVQVALEVDRGVLAAEMGIALLSRPRCRRRTCTGRPSSTSTSRASTDTPARSRRSRGRSTAA